MKPHMQSTAPDIPFHAYLDRTALAEALAAQVAQELKQAMKAQGSASLVVSGGSTPLPFFEALKTHDIDWSKLTVTLADERFVDPSHDDSNEKLVREHLLTGSANFIPLFYSSQTLSEAAKLANAAIAALPHPFDVVILGMGDDAHTASLFPHHPQLAAALDPANTALCLPITDSPKPPPERITLTYRALIHSRKLYLHITGAGKRTVVEKALTTHDPAAMPISAFLHQDQTPVEIWWAE